MLLVTLEDLEPGFRQRLQFCVLRTGNQSVAQRAIDSLVVRDLVGNVGLVESIAAEGSEFCRFRLCLLHQSRSSLHRDRRLEAGELGDLGEASQNASSAQRGEFAGQHQRQLLVAHLYPRAVDHAGRRR